MTYASSVGRCPGDASSGVYTYFRFLRGVRHDLPHPGCQVISTPGPGAGLAGTAHSQDRDADSVPPHSTPLGGAYSLAGIARVFPLSHRDDESATYPD